MNEVFILHTVGLGHSTKTGLMYYTVSLNINYDIIEDTERIYPSFDDLEALRFLYEKQSDIIIVKPKNNIKVIMHKLKKVCSLLD